MKTHSVNHVFVLFAFGLLSLPIAAAREAPTVGLLYGVKERNSLWFKCNLSGETLTCDFTQTSVRKKAKPADWSEAESRTKAAFRQEQAKPEKACWSNDLLAVQRALRSNDLKGLSKVQQEKLAAMNLMERRDGIAILDALQAACTLKSEAAMVALAKVTFEKDQRTCLVSSHTFKQRFRWVDDFGGRGAWVTDDKPTGPCGEIQLSRFEPDPTTKPSLRFWKYYARKAVTNPHGKMYGAMKCSERDQGTYPYDWSGPNDIGMGCDYISFSSF